MTPISSSRRLLIGNFVLRLSTSRHLSTSASNPNSTGFQFHHQSRRHHEEESKNVKVFVWWDFENCAPPVGESNVYRVSQRITAAIRGNGIKGPVHITAFGDVVQLSRSNQVALSATGIVLTHVPRGAKSSADRSLLMDLLYWVSQNPPPAHLFLISGDTDFASILHRLRMNNYNILLASRDDASGVLCSAASIMWDWNALVKGANLTGKYFNQPPDGPYSSWYGHYRVPIEDPFAVSEQPGCLQSELSNSNSEAKPRSVPRAVVNAIHSILKSNPQGISITELRAELGKTNLTIEKDLYGYKKFSRFLLSMPHILTIESEGNGNYSVRGVAPNVSQIGESSLPICPGPVTNNTENLDSTVSSKRIGGDMSCNGAGPVNNTENLVSTVSSVKMGGDSSSKINGRDMSFKGAGNEKSSSPSSKSNTKKSVTELQEPLEKVAETQSEVQSSSLLVEKKSKVEVVANQLHSPGISCVPPEEGFLNRIWSKWLRGKENCEVESRANVGEYFTPNDNTEKIKHKVQCVESIGTSPDPVGLSAPSSSSKKAGLTSSSSSSNEKVVDEDINNSSVVNDDKPSKRPGIFSRIMSWCNFRKSDQDAESMNEEVGGRKKRRSMDLEMQKLFSESIWNDMMTFLKTPKGSESILQSKTRKEIVQNLQKKGPSSLSSLSEAHLFHLVDLLISDRHWVVESTSQPFPFRLVLPVGKSSQKSTKEPSFILSDPDSKLESKLGRGEKDGEKRCQNLPHSGVPPHANKPSDKSRAQVLGDCQKLLNEILKEYPDGYNMASFRRLFLVKYGYSLDVQKLGYQKLATLLQIMPGVKVESIYIYPSERVLKGSSAGDTDPSTTSSRKDLKSDRESSKKDNDNSDSPWEELGPVAANSGPRRSNGTGWLSRVVKEESAGPQMLHNYETVSHDHESSDSEEEMLSLTEGSEGQGKHRKNEEDSSLLEILDSWYSSKEDNRRVAACASQRAVDGTVDSCKSGSKPASPSRVSISNEDDVEVNFARKQIVPNTCTFLGDEPGDEKDKLIDGVLGSLKKSGDGLSESRI